MEIIMSSKFSPVKPIWVISQPACSTSLVSNAIAFSVAANASCSLPSPARSWLSCNCELYVSWSVPTNASNSTFFCACNSFFCFSSSSLVIPAVSRIIFSSSVVNSFCLSASEIDKCCT